MATEKKFLVKGNFEGMEIEENVMAYTVRQAKLKAGFNLRLYGENLKKLMQSKRIRARKSK